MPLLIYTAFKILCKEWIIQLGVQYITIVLLCKVSSMVSLGYPDVIRSQSAC